MDLLLNPANSVALRADGSLATAPCCESGIHQHVVDIQQLAGVAAGEVRSAGIWFGRTSEITECISGLQCRDTQYYPILFLFLLHTVTIAVITITCYYLLNCHCYYCYYYDDVDYYYYYYYY